MADQPSLLYSVENVDLTIEDVLEGISTGLTDMQAGNGGSGFEGGIAMLVRIPAEWAEIVESAAAQNGVNIVRVEDDDAEQPL